MMQRKIFFTFILILTFFFNVNYALSAESPDNVGDFFKSLEQGGAPNNTLDAGGEVQSLPGSEIKPEQMQKAFPNQLQQDAPHMDFIPDAAPLFPALPLQQSGPKATQDNIKSPSVPAPQDVLQVQFNNKNSTQTTSGTSKMLPITPEKPEQNKTSQDENNQLNGFQNNNKQENAKATLQSPSLEMMIGQMIMAGFTGGELEKDAAILNLIQEGKVGGVFLVASAKKLEQSNNVNQTTNAKQENIYSPSQVRVLTAMLQGSVSNKSLPLFIAIEQEGGLVQSLRTDLGFSGLKAAASLGQEKVESTEIAARSAGLEMAGLGINFALAPAADVNINPLSEDIGKKFRSFSPNPQVVAAHAIAFGKGLMAANVVPCLRNFPGTGSRMGGFSARTNVGDTQNILYDIPDIAASWQSRELIPYTKAIESGWQGAIQPALIYHRALDALHPAPLSRTLLNGILRGRMGFNGIIVSQDLRALQPIYSLEAAVIQAVLAGVDIILISEPAHLKSVSQDSSVLESLPIDQLLSQNGDLTKQLLRQGLGKAMPGMGFDATLEQKIQTGYADEATKVYDILLNAVQNGRIPVENIRASWHRILKTKQSFLDAGKK